MPAGITFDVEGLPWLELPTSLPSAEHGTATTVAGLTLGILDRHLGAKVATQRWGARFDAYLEHAARGQFSHLFLWLSDPILPVAVVTVETYPAQGDAADVLPTLGGAPSGEPVSVPGLGDGTRFEVTEQVRKGIFGKATRRTVRWVWRVEETDVIVTLERDDEESLARMLPDTEALLATAAVAR